MSNAHEYGRKAYAVAAQHIGAIEPPAVLHPNNAGLSAYGEGKAPAGLQTTAQWLQEARDTWEQVNQVRTVADPALTEDGHVLRVNQVAERGIERICKGYDRAKQALATAEAGYLAEIDAATRMTPTAHAAEIRAVVRAMPEQERYSTLLNAMNTGDAVTLAAVLNAPGITSGLTDDQVSNLRAMYQRKAAPDAVASLEAVRKAQRKVMVAFDLVLEQSDALTLRQRAGAVKERQRQAQEAARLAEGSLDRWSL